MSRKSSWQTYVTGVGLWLNNFPNAQAWLSGQSVEDSGSPKHHGLNRQCARRASPFAKTMAACYHEATEQAQVDRVQTAIIFGSALGESDVMLQLLRQMLTTPEDFSPMLFAVSVHNASSGLVSISNQNRAFTTSIAADYDTPAMGLWEAFTTSQTFSTPAVLVCGDEATPEGLVREDERFVRVAAALVIETNPPQDLPYLASLTDLRLMSSSEERTIQAPLAPLVARNPQAGLIDLVDVILHQSGGRVRLDRGEGQGWSVQVNPFRGHQ